jgi:hypothetical protein
MGWLEKERTYAMLKVALGAPIESVLRTGGIPGNKRNAVLAAVEVRGCKHVVLEALIARVACACRRGRR